MQQKGNNPASNQTSATKAAARSAWAAAIRGKRQELGENQTTFAERFGVSRVTVSYWERGIFDPPGEVTWWLTHDEVPA